MKFISHSSSDSRLKSVHEEDGCKQLKRDCQLRHGSSCACYSQHAMTSEKMEGFQVGIYCILECFRNCFKKI